MTWTDIQERNVKRLGDNCSKLSNEYYDAEKRQRKLYFILSGASITSIFSSAMISFLFPDYTIIGGLLGFTSGFITGCNNFLSLSSKAENSRGTRLRLNSLFATIQNELSMPRNERYTSSIFVVQKQNEYYHIIQSADTLIMDGDKDRLSVDSIKISDGVIKPNLEDIFDEK